MGRSAYHDDLEFNEESMDKRSFIDSYYFDMNEQEQLRFNMFARAFASGINSPSRNWIPPEYRGISKRMNAKWKSPKLNADPSLLPDEATYEVIQYLARTWYEQQPMTQLLAPVTTTLTKPAWMIKWYKIDQDPTPYPEFTAGGPNAFRNLKAFKLGIEPLTASGIGAGLRYDLSWTLKAEANGIYDPEQWHNYEATKNFGVFWDERQCLGTGGEHTSADLGVKGVFNAASILTEAIGAGADNSVAAAGDIDAMIYQFLGDMRTFKEPGQNILLTTSGVASEVLLHDSSYTDRTEYERIKNKWFNSGFVSKWIIDDNILNATPTTTTQRAMMFRLSEHTIKRVVVYPFQKKPLANVEFPDDISFAFLVADIVTYIATGAPAATYAYYSASANVTSTVAGFIANGLFMQGNAPGMVNPATPPRMPGFYP